MIDDGSSDDTAAVARRHALEDPRVRAISREYAIGAAGERAQRGDSRARGKYIALLDADDTCVPTRIEKQVRAMELTGYRIRVRRRAAILRRHGHACARGGTLALAGFVEGASRYLEPVADDVYLCSQSFGAFLLTYVAVVHSR